VRSSHENSTEIDRLGRTGICCDRMTCVAPTRPVVRVVAIRRLDRSATIPPDTLIPAQALLLVARETTDKLRRKGRRPWRWIAGCPRPLVDSSNTVVGTACSRDGPWPSVCTSSKRVGQQARHRLELTGTAKGASAPFRKTYRRALFLTALALRDDQTIVQIDVLVMGTKEFVYAETAVKSAAGAEDSRAIKVPWIERK